jgi:uncharacterized protein
VRISVGGLQLEWDNVKARANLRKHGLDFLDAAELFTGALYTAPDLRHDYGEDRWTGIGQIKGRTVVITFSQPGINTVRVISLRKATRRERREYEKIIEDELGKG